MHQLNKPAKTVLTMAVALALSNSKAIAQESNQANDTDVESERQLEKIIVTSTRRSENQQLVPIAVEAMSGETRH